MNDGKVDRQGRFVVGYMDYEERDPICGLFRLDPGGGVAKLDDGIVCSNGPYWSPDGRTFYFADTYKREIWAYDYDSIPAASPTGARSARLTVPAAARPTARPSTRKAVSGARWSMTAGWCATAGWQGRPRDRNAGQESDQRDVWRP